LEVRMQKPWETQLSLSAAHWRHTQVADGDKGLEDISGRITRVLMKGTNECIGTAARIGPDGLSVSCRHVFVEDGQFLEATGWGEELRFVASSPHDDLIFLKGDAEGFFASVLVGKEPSQVCESSKQMGRTHSPRDGEAKYSPVPAHEQPVVTSTA